MLAAQALYTNKRSPHQSINQNIIAGACIDGFDSEPIRPDNPLIKVKHPEELVLSPHNAWASVESREKRLILSVKILNRTLKKMASMPI